MIQVEYPCRKSESGRFFRVKKADRRDASWKETFYPGDESAAEMRSRHADIYNHDEDAATYDQDVLRSDDPVREGYTEVLDWVAKAAGITPESAVLELGSGTGNLTVRLPACRSLACVDVSGEMTRIARQKLRGRSHIRFFQADLLDYLGGDPPPFDVALSTYALHHLTEAEKEHLFDRLAERLLPGGRALFGDLMVKSAKEKRVLADHYRATGDDATATAIEEEFLWHVDASAGYLSSLGLSVETTRFSTLSWGIKVQLPEVAGV